MLHPWKPVHKFRSLLKAHDYDLPDHGNDYCIRHSKRLWPRRLRVSSVTHLGPLSMYAATRLVGGRAVAAHLLPISVSMQAGVNDLIIISV